MKHFSLMSAILLFAAGLLSEQKSVPADEPAAAEFYGVSIENRIGVQVDAIAPLSLVESLDRLYLMEYYEWPGARLRSRVYSVNDKGRYLQNEDIMKTVWSNRLFRKCFAETAALPKEKAAGLINAEIDKTLPGYVEEFDALIEGRKRGYVLREGPDGKPTMTGLRYKLFALILIAGSLELTETASSVRELAALAMEQKEKCDARAAEIYDRIAKEAPRPKNILRISPDGPLLYASLYNVYVLAGGLYGTAPEKEKRQAYTARWTDRKLVDYSAAKTEFDRWLDRTPVPDKEYIALRWIDTSTDADMSELFYLTKPEGKE